MTSPPAALRRIWTSAVASPASRLEAAALAALGGGLLAVAVLIGVSPRDAPVARWSVVAVIAIGLGLVAAVGRGRQRRRSSAWVLGGLRALAGDRHGRSPTRTVGAAVWACLILAIACFDATSFVVRGHDLPTLSWLFGHLTVSGWGRSLVFIAWAGWGAWGVFGWRKPA